VPRLRSRIASAAPTQALRAFLRTEVASGVFLVVAAIAALVWANSPWQAGYDRLWTTHATVAVGRASLRLDLRHWLNDGLMALFFFVVALEIKRELVDGELRNRRTAAVPVLAAVGGMVVPAVIYLGLNRHGPAAHGWGVPMATDIAFAVGVLALVARSAPVGARLFLLTLAIVDDIGAIVVIAVVYSHDLSLAWAGVAVVVVGLVGLGRIRGLRSPPLYLVLGLVLWVALHAAGVHPTLAGVAMGLLVPAGGIEQLEGRLHPWTSFVVVPLFALANAGVSLSSSAVADAVGSTVTLGVVLGLVVGKAAGIVGASWVATRVGIGELPEEVGWRHVLGLATLGGIGFTVSIFIAGLAFDGATGAALTADAKLGILTASVLASLVGWLLLHRAGDAR
jgi:NhaA family Na+:H+ antiporter